MSDYAEWNAAFFLFQAAFTHVTRHNPGLGIMASVVETEIFDSGPLQQGVPSLLKLEWAAGGRGEGTRKDPIAVQPSDLCVIPQHRKRWITDRHSPRIPVLGVAQRNRRTPKINISPLQI